MFWRILLYQLPPQTRSSWTRTSGNSLSSQFTSMKQSQGNFRIIAAIIQTRDSLSFHNSPQMLQNFATILAANASSIRSANHSLTAPEYYTIHVEGSKITLNIEYHSDIPLDREERSYVLFIARAHMQAQRDAHGELTLLPKDDPYRANSFPEADVIFQLQSIKPFRPTYTTAMNAIMGLARFFVDPDKSGAVRCLISDQSISGRDGHRPVADMLVWPGRV